MSETLFYGSKNLVGIGNVGIGTTDPQTALDLTGVMRFSGATTTLAGINLPTSGAGINWGNYFSRIIDDGDLRFVTDDNMHWHTGSAAGTPIGTERITLLANGNVGIGVASPGTSLDVLGGPIYAQGRSAGGAAAPGIGTYGSGNGDRIILYTGSGSTYPYSFGIDGSTLWYNTPTGSTHKFYVGGSIEQSINSTGVGIGTDNPAVALDAYTGAMNAASVTLTSTPAATANVLTVIGSSTTGNVVQFSNTNGGTFIMTKDGRIAIGNLNPAFALDIEIKTSNDGARVRNLSTATNALCGWRLGNANGANQGGIDCYGSGFTTSGLNRQDGIYTYSGGAGGYTINASITNSNVYIATVNTERMRITSAGNVGIGTGAPASALDVYTGAMNAASVTLTSTPAAAANVLTVRGSSTQGNVVQFSNTASGTFVMTNAGRIGLGLTAPTVQLDLSTDGARKLTTTAWTTGSDQRIKTDIQLANLHMCYDVVKTIDLKYFKWNFPSDSNISVDDKHSLGFIAQDVKAVFPNAVYESDSYGFSDFLNLNTDQIIKAMYGALRQTMSDKEDLEQSLATATATIGSLETQLQTAQNDIDLLESRLAAIEALISTNTSADTGSAPTGTRADALLSQV
jgi:hypothetical protein